MGGKLEEGRAPPRQDAQVIARLVGRQGLKRLVAVDAEALDQAVDGRAAKTQLPALLEDTPRVVRLTEIGQGVNVADPELAALWIAVDGDLQEGQRKL